MTRSWRAWPPRIPGHGSSAPFLATSLTAWPSPSSTPTSSGSSTRSWSGCAATVSGPAAMPTGSVPPYRLPRQPGTGAEPMTMPMTREQAAAAVAAATAQRDGIQANLLDLDGSFGKRLLDGATLAGESKRRWEAAAADLAALWDIFTAYAAVVDPAAGLLGSGRRLGSNELAAITAMLNGTSVVLTRAPTPLARRDLTDRGRADLTLAAAVAEMKRAFASVTEVVTAAESVWNETADGLTEIGSGLGAAQQQGAGLSDAEGTEARAGGGAELGRMREVLSTDPLALWQHGRVDTGRLERLRTQAAAAEARAGELARGRAGADRRGATAERKKGGWGK